MDVINITYDKFGNIYINNKLLLISNDYNLELIEIHNSENIYNIENNI